MRTEPVLVEARPRAALSVVPAYPTPYVPGPAAGIPAGGQTPSGARRWGRLAGISLLVLLATSPLSAAGPVGQVMAALIGFPAVVLFGVSVVGAPVAAVRATWTSLRPEAFVPRSRYPSPVVAGPRRPAHRGTHLRVTGAEDNWVKGARGEQAVGAALACTGLPVLHDRRLRQGSRANIDHVVVAADAVYVVDAKNITGSLVATGGTLRINGRDRDSLLQGVRLQARELEAALDRLGVAVPVRPMLCLTGSARPAGMQFVGGVLLTTPFSLASALTLPGPLAGDRRAAIADDLAWAFPPAVSD